MPQQILEVDEDSLPEAYQAALKAKQAGQDYIYVSFAPPGLVGKYVQLWEGAAGEVIGRCFYEEDELEHDQEGDTAIRAVPPDYIVRRTTRAVIVRARTADITEAYKRMITRERREYHEDVPANQIRRKPTAQTVR